MKRFVSFQCINNLVFLKQFCFCIALLIIIKFIEIVLTYLCVGCFRFLLVSVPVVDSYFRWLRVSVVLEVSCSASVLNFRSWCRPQFPDESPTLNSRAPHNYKIC